MHRRVALLLFATGWGANHFATMLIVYKRDLGLSASDLGILFGAYALGLVPGLILAGRVSDRRGRRAVVMPASLVAMLGSAALAFGSYGFAVLFAGRLLYGLGMGCMMSPGSVWVQELSAAGEGARRATLALSAGFGIGPLVTGVIAELAPLPMVLPYLVHIAVLIVALVMVRGVPETAAAKTVSPVDSEPARSSLRARELLVLAELLPAAPWTFAFAAGTGAILPVVMRPFVARPILYSAFIVVTTLMSGVFVQPLTQRLGRRGDLVGFGLGIAGILIAAHAVAAESPAIGFPAAVLLGAGYGLIMTTGLREVSQRAPASVRGSAVGLYYVLTYTGFALPFIYASVARSAGNVHTWLYVACAAAVCLVIRAGIERKNG